MLLVVDDDETILSFLEKAQGEEKVISTVLTTARSLSQAGGRSLQTNKKSLSWSRTRHTNRNPRTRLYVILIHTPRK